MKLKRKSVTVVLLSVALLCVALGVRSTLGIYLPSTRTVGVQVGNWATYSVLAEGNMTGFNATTPESYTFTITGISGANVTCQTFEKFTNGTQETGTGSVDVNSGSGNMTGFLIAANLNQNDSVYNGSGGFFPGAIINYTTTRNYLGSNVEVCQSNTTERTTTVEYSYFDSYNFTWFRANGMLAEATVNMTEVVSGTFSWLYEHIIVTSNSSVPEFPESLVLPLLAAFSILAVVIAKKRLIKK
jgi:uncharacterized membrane protein